MIEPDAQRESKRPPFAWLVDWWRREWRRTAVILLALAAVLLVVRGIANLVIGHQLNEEVSRLERLYGRLDPGTLAPAQVPAAENRARVVRAAASLLVVGPAESATLTRLNQRYVPSPPVEDLRGVVEQNQLALQVAEQIRRRPKSNWEIDYAHDTNLPRLLDIRNLGILLAVSCRVDLETGRVDRAAEAALAGFAEAASLRQEPILIIQLIRIAIAREQLRCARDLLARGEPAAATLTDLAAALAENRTPEAMHAAFIRELKHANNVFGQMERGEPVNDTGVMTASPAWAGPVSWLVRPLIRYGHLRQLGNGARVIEMESAPPSARSAAIADAVRVAGKGRWWQLGRRFDSLFTPGLMRAADAGYENLSEVNAAQLAVALRRFRLDRGAYPGALTDLVPQYLAQVPADPFTGRSPEYLRRDAGFELRVHGAPETGSDLLEWKIPR